MTDQQHPITPPPELVAKIRSQALLPSISQQDYEDQLVIAAYRAGAARRPKPKSQAEEALQAIAAIEASDGDYRQFEQDIDTIRRALERLQELEGRGDG